MNIREKFREVLADPTWAETMDDVIFENLVGCIRNLHAEIDRLKGEARHTRSKSVYFRHGDTLYTVEVCEKVNLIMMPLNSVGFSLRQISADEAEGLTKRGIRP